MYVNNKNHSGLITYILRIIYDTNSAKIYFNLCKTKIKFDFFT